MIVIHHVHAGAPARKSRPHAPRDPASDAKGTMLARGRLSDARKWFAHRGWKVLPQGIRGQRILAWGACHAWLASPSNSQRSVRNWCRLWAPWLKDAELDQLVGAIAKFW
jgi:hypothetical protein